MKLTKVGAIAASAVFVFAACTPARAGRQRQRAAPPERSPRSARTRRARARTRSTCTRRCRARARTRPRPTRSSSRSTQIIGGKTVGNFTIKYTDLDDSSAANNGDWDGAVAQQNATTAANDPDAMVFIGHFNSGAAKLTIPILNAACLVMISPANTYPGLTTAVEGVTEPGEPDSYYPNGYRNYSRVISTDNKQGGAGAAWAKELGATKAYVLDDTQVYGKGLARSWALSANQLGIEVVSAERHERRLRRQGDGLRRPGPEDQGLRCGLHLHRIHHRPEHGQALEGPPGRHAGHQDHVGRRRLRGGVVRRHGRRRQRHVPDLRRRRPERADLRRRQEVGRRLQGGARRRRSARLRHLRCSRGPARAGRADPAGTNDRYEVLKAVFATKDFASYLGTFSIKPDGDTTLAEATGYQVVDSWPPKFEKVLAAPE